MFSRKWTWHTGRLPVALAITIVAIGLFVHVMPWLGAGLGASDDGYNAATWALGARGGVEDPIGNRMGGVQPDGTKYAHHPPLMLWSLMPVTAINDAWPTGLRLVPLIASLASAVILASLLLDAHLGTYATAAGVLLAGSSAMFLTFGAMVDTPVFSFPFALAAVWAAQRSWQGRPPPTSVVVAVGLLAALSGWQAFLAAVIAAGVAGLRPAGASRRAAMALLVGAFAGVILDLLWVWWVMGSLSDLVDAGAFRGDVDTGVGAWFARQWSFVQDGFGFTLVAILCAGTAATVFESRRGPTLRLASAQEVGPDHNRAEPNPTADPGGHVPTASAWDTALPLFAVVIATVLIYSAIFRQGAYIHAYWNYFMVALVGVTAAALLDAVDRLTRRFSATGRRLVIGLLAVLVVTVAGLGLARRSMADYVIRRGLVVVPLLDELPKAHDPNDVVVATIGGVPDKPWLDWSTRGRHESVGPSDIKHLPAEKPVLVTLPNDPDPSVWSGTSASSRGVFAVIPAGELAMMIEE